MTMMVRLLVVLLSCMGGVEPAPTSYDPKNTVVRVHPSMVEPKCPWWRDAPPEEMPQEVSSEEEGEQVEDEDYEDWEEDEEYGDWEEDEDYVYEEWEDDQEELEEEESFKEWSDTWWEQPITRHDMRRKWNCKAYLEGDETKLSIHNASTFASLKEIYDVVAGENSTIRPLKMESGFAVPFELTVTPGKGRGIIAREKIPKDTLVWSSLGQTACFQNAVMYRKFLSLIPSQTACEILHWHYAIDFSLFLTHAEEAAGIWDSVDMKDYEEDPSSIVVCVELDESAMLNDGNFDGVTVSTNLYHTMIDEENRVSGYFAARDIEEGEEILADYSEFDFYLGIDFFGI